MIKTRNQGRKEEKQQVKATSHDDIEPKHRVVIAVSRFFHVGKRYGESTVLQFLGYEGKDGNHGHHAIVGL